MAKAKPAKYKMQLNSECVPDDTDMGMTNNDVRTVESDIVCPAYYPFPSKEHGHHLQDATYAVDMAIWSWNEQGRMLHEEDLNHDSTIVSKRRGK